MNTMNKLTEAPAMMNTHHLFHGTLLLATLGLIAQACIGSTLDERAMPMPREEQVRFDGNCGLRGPVLPRGSSRYMTLRVGTRLAPASAEPTPTVIFCRKEPLVPALV